MGFIQSILMGIVQGLSEFLPISSSAHLVFTSNFYKVFKGIEIVQQSNEEIFFDIMLHLGTLIAVIIFFRKEIYEIARDLFIACKNKDFSNHNAKLGLYIILGTVITIALALPLNDVAEHLVYHPALVGGLLIVTGFVLFFSEYLSKKRDNKKNSEGNNIETEHERMLLEKNIKIYKERIKSLTEAQLNLVNDLDKIEI